MNRQPVDQVQLRAVALAIRDGSLEPVPWRTCLLAAEAVLQALTGKCDAIAAGAIMAGTPGQPFESAA